MGTLTLMRSFLNSIDAALQENKGLYIEFIIYSKQLQKTNNFRIFNIRLTHTQIELHTHYTV